MKLNECKNWQGIMDVNCKIGFKPERMQGVEGCGKRCHGEGNKCDFYTTYSSDDEWKEELRKEIK